MDITTQLVLMSKAKKVFGNDQTFLSFPLTPQPYTKQQLNFLEDKNLENLQRFSMLVNHIPTGETWQPTDSTYLWDIYRRILVDANYAESTRTPAEELAYQKAYQLLFRLRDDGTPIDSPTLTAYKRFKDAWIVAQESYNSAKTSAFYLTDPVAIQQWTTIDEPRLRNQMTTCQDQWVIEGFKNEVEAAFATRQTLGARSPYQTLSEWKKLWIQEIDNLTSAIDQSSAPASSFSPSNALADSAWQSHQMGEAEINALFQESPAELRSRLGAASPNLSELSFEVSSATIVRPWFASDALKARFWKFNDASQLSDGGMPARGDCPAYVTAIVFARKLTTTQKPAPDPQPDPKPDPKPVVIRPRPIPVDEIQPRVKLGKIGGDRLRMSPLKPMAIPALEVADKRLLLKDALIKDTLVREDMLQLRRERVFSNLTEATFDRVVQPGQTQEQKDPSKKQSVTDDSIYILAMVCKRVPKCPDPDLTLHW